MNVGVRGSMADRLNPKASGVASAWMFGVALGATSGPVSDGVCKFHSDQPATYAVFTALQKAASVAP